MSASPRRRFELFAPRAAVLTKPDAVVTKRDANTSVVVTVYGRTAAVVLEKLRTLEVEHACRP